MTTIDHQAAVAVGSAAAADVGSTGLAAAVADWLTTTDHKKIGRLFVGASLVFALAVAGVGMVLAIERIDSTANVIHSNALPQLFALFRVVLTFGVVVPLGLGLAIAIVPLQLGARALAFPRLAAAGFWSWLIGTGLVIGSILGNGGPGGGSVKLVNLYLAAHVLMVLGLLAGAAAVATSVLTTRAPGMNLRRVPLFAWSALVGALGLLLVGPVLIGVLVLLYVDHRGPRSTFGGNTGIDGWAGFASTQPQTFLYAIPAFGIAIELIVTAVRTRIKLRGFALGGLGLLLAAAIAGVSQTSATLRPDFRHLDGNAVFNDLVPYVLFNVVPVLGAALVLGVGLFALVTNRPKIRASLLFGFFGAGIAVVGMLANGVDKVGDAKLAGTVFEEGAWIAVSYGVVLAVLGGILHWGPKLWGRTVGDAKAIPLALVGALGAVLASGSYLIAGFAKQPASSTIFTYGGPHQLWNVLATVGHGLFVVALFGFIIVALTSFSGDLSNAAGDDPWDGQTLEWATASPAPADNFAEVHTVASSAPLLDLKPVSEAASKNGAS
jgi:cytochrome o ubiquinol oxidase subunit 1